MHLRPVRLALHVGAASLLATAGVLMTGAPGHADSASRPDSYGGAAAASAFHYFADRNPQPTVVTDAFHAEVPYAITSFDSSGDASATAASIYPGAGLLGVPALLCQFNPFVCQVISAAPRYPFIAKAEYPRQKDDSATVNSGTIEQGPLTVTPGGTTAHADTDRVEARTEVGSTAAEGVMTLGHAVTHSKQSFEGSTLVVTAESIVSNLDIGGQLHIDQVRSTAVAKVNGGSVTSSTATTTVSGATVAGTPVTIDSTGIHAGGQGDGGAVKAAVNTALAQLKTQGIDMRLTEPTKRVKDGAAAASTGGLLITFTHTVSGVNPPPPPPPIPGPPSINGDYGGSVTVAGAGVSGFAAPAQGLDLGALPPSVSAAVPPSLGGVSQPGAGSAPLPPGAPAVASSPAGPALAGAAPQARPIAVLGVDVTPKRLKMLTLFLLAYPLLVLLSAPLRAPARLPRSF